MERKKYRWCAVPQCTNTSKTTPNKIFIDVPRKADIRKKWLNLARRMCDGMSVTSPIYFCEDHFDLPNDMENYMRYHVMGTVDKVMSKHGCLPTKFQCQSDRKRSLPSTVTSWPAAIKKRRLALVQEALEDSTLESDTKEANTTLSPSSPVEVIVEHQPKNQDKGVQVFVKSTYFRNSVGREQDPLSRVIEQCRFCGEFSKDCVAVSSDMTYLAGNKTTLALNDTSVQLDFNHRSLPKAVCRDCDAKLQEFCDFVNVVKAAQGTLINVAEEKEEFETGAEFEETTTDFEETTADFEEREKDETETLIIKTEYDSQQEDSDDDKEGIVDSLTVGETVFVRETHKRKSDTDNTKPKKLKTKEKCGGDNDLIIDIKEEVVEKDANDGHGQSEVSDTGTDVKPSELELATNALVFEMAEEGTSEYQGYRSDR